VARIESTTVAGFEAAQAVPAHYPDQSFSLADRTSWALMEHLAITQALAFDTDFRIHSYGPQKPKPSQSTPDSRRFPLRTPPT
jgi:predicted nucleic acid-binding protein